MLLDGDVLDQRVLSVPTYGSETHTNSCTIVHKTEYETRHFWENKRRSLKEFFLRNMTRVIRRGRTIKNSEMALGMTD